MRLRVDAHEYVVDVAPGSVTVDGCAFQTEVEVDAGAYVVTVGDRTLRLERTETGFLVDSVPYTIQLATPDALTAPSGPPPSPVAATTAHAHSHGARVVAHMPGQVMAILVRVGDQVKESTVVAVIEAMKMENEIVAGEDGIIKAVQVAVGQSVNQGDVIAELQ